MTKPPSRICGVPEEIELENVLDVSGTKPPSRLYDSPSYGHRISDGHLSPEQSPEAGSTTMELVLIALLVEILSQVLSL